MKSVTIEDLAQEIHESARAAVTSGNTVAHDQFGDKTYSFVEWEDLSDSAREGKFTQAAYLLESYNITEKE